MTRSILVFLAVISSTVTGIAAEPCGGAVSLVIRQTASFPAGAAIHSSPALIGLDRLVVGSDDFQVYFIGKDGKKKAAFKTKGKVRSSPLVMSDGGIVVGSDDGNVYFLTREGKKEAVFKTGDKVRSSPVLAKDGTVVVASDDGKLYFLGPDGKQRRRAFATNSKLGSPVIMPDGTIAVGSDDGNLYFVNSDGTLRKAEGIGRLIEPLALTPDGDLLVSSFDGKAHVFDAKGARKETLDAGPGPLSPAIATPDGTIVVASSSGDLKFFKNQALVRSVPIGSGVSSVPRVLADGSIMVGTYDRDLVIVGADGTQKAQFRNKGWAFGRPAIIGDGALAIGSGDGTLKFLALTSECVQPARGSSLRIPDDKVKELSPNESDAGGNEPAGSAVKASE